MREHRTSRVTNEPRRTHLVSLSAVTWDFALVGRTRMLTEQWLALQQPTTFVQIPSLRTAAERLSEPLARRCPDHVVRPWPSYPARLWQIITPERLVGSFAARARALRRQLETRLSLQHSVALVVSPIWLPWLDALPFGRIIYDCIDNVQVMTPRPELLPTFQEWERRLLQRVDAVVTSATCLARRFRSDQPELPVTTIQNGVDAEAFVRRASENASPSDLPRRPGVPIIGFVGALYDWIDWDLILAVARRLPEFDFVFVGPYARGALPPTLARQHNCRFLGPRSYDDIPGYIAGFDVCWVPFAASDVSREANPVKIYEYLALGKPVVTTPVADIDSFEGLVRLGRTPDEIALLLRRAKTESTTDLDLRRSYAQRNSWRARATQYIDFTGSISARSASASEPLNAPRDAASDAVLGRRRREPRAPRAEEIQNRWR